MGGFLVDPCHGPNPSICKKGKEKESAYRKYVVFVAEKLCGGE